MNCQNCKFANFTADSFEHWRILGHKPQQEPLLFGTCQRLIATTTENLMSDYEPELANSNLQPPAFAFQNTEVGIHPVEIVIRQDFGCILFEPKPSSKQK